MNRLLLILFVIVVVFLLTRPKKGKFGKMSKFNGGNIVSSSTTNDIDETNGETVIIFYALWCGHCKESMTDFKDAVSKSYGKIKLINGDEEPELVIKYNVKGYPTIVKTNGKEHKGHRDIDSILDFAGITP